MKKILLLAAAVAMISTASQAQEVKFGVKAGVNLANFGGDAEGTNMKAGLHIGGVANLMITDMFALAPELLFSMQGTKTDGMSFMGVSIPETKTNLTYINIPVLAKVYVTEGLNIHAGPYLGFLLAAKAKVGDDDTDIKDGLKSTDFGIAAGVGYDLPTGLNFGARFNAGLANISDSGEGSDDSKLTNQVIQIYAGFNF